MVGQSLCLPSPRDNRFRNTSGFATKNKKLFLHIITLNFEWKQKNKYIIFRTTLLNVEFIFLKILP